MSGLIAGVIGGILVGLLSHSQVSVTGPAAGLIAIVLDATKTLPSLPMFFMAVFIAGVLQMGLGLLRAGNMAYYIPSNVIKGMLAAIGIIIIMKQIPHAVGWDADAEGDFAFLQADGENTITEIFHAINYISPGAVAVAIVGFFIMILWKKIKIPGLSVLPAGLVVVITGIAMQLLFA